MINIILHTDMILHSEIVAKLSKCAEKLEEMKTQLNYDVHNENKLEETHRTTIIKSLVHLADLSNPVLIWNLSHECAIRVVDEFYNQSQIEKEQDLPVQEFMTKRDIESIAKLQMSFIDYVVRPFWKTAARVVPELQHRLETLDSNRNKWTTYGQTGFVKENVDHIPWFRNKTQSS